MFVLLLLPQGNHQNKTQCWKILFTMTEIFQEENVDIVIPDYTRGLFSPVFCPLKWHQSLNNHWFKCRRCENSATEKCSPFMWVPGLRVKNARFSKISSVFESLLWIILMFTQIFTPLSGLPQILLISLKATVLSCRQAETKTPKLPSLQSKN